MNQPSPFPILPERECHEPPSILRHPEESPASTAKSVPAVRPKRVLIVDDDTLVRASLASVLQCEGYDVYGAADGENAVRCAFDHGPDLVLLDLTMPTMDGWTTFTK